MKNVLVVDDDKYLRSAFTAKLRKEGFVALEAVNGAQALEMMRSSRPDLVLLDILMPVKDGVATLQEMRTDAALKDVPVIVLSNSVRVTDRERMEKLGVQGFHFKSDTPMATIIELIKKRA